MRNDSDGTDWEKCFRWSSPWVAQSARSDTRRQCSTDAARWTSPRRTSDQRPPRATCSDVVCHRPSQTAEHRHNTQWRRSNVWVTELRFNVARDTKWITLQTLFPANLLVSTENKAKSNAGETTTKIYNKPRLTYITMSNNRSNHSTGIQTYYNIKLTPKKAENQTWCLLQPPAWNRMGLFSKR